MLFELLVIIAVVGIIGLLLPRLGLFVGPALIILGAAPLLLLFLVPSALGPRVEEHYGLLSTIAFVVLCPSGVVVTILSAFAIRR